MKKYKLFAALLAVALIASGCGAEKQAETDNEMYIEQAQLTDEKSNLLCTNIITNDEAEDKITFWIDDCLYQVQHKPETSEYQIVQLQ